MELVQKKWNEGVKGISGLWWLLIVQFSIVFQLNLPKDNFMYSCYSVSPFTKSLNSNHCFLISYFYIICFFHKFNVTSGKFYFLLFNKGSKISFVSSNRGFKGLYFSSRVNLHKFKIKNNFGRYKYLRSFIIVFEVFLLCQLGLLFWEILLDTSLILIFTLLKFYICWWT